MNGRAERTVKERFLEWLFMEDYGKFDDYHFTRLIDTWHNDGYKRPEKLKNNSSGAMTFQEFCFIHFIVCERARLEGLRVEFPTKEFDKILKQPGSYFTGVRPPLKAEHYGPFYREVVK